MKNSRLAGTGIVAVILLSALFGGNIHGANGGRLSGGACSPKAPVFDFDADKDGISDDSDNCPSTFNPNQSDEDGNGIGEVCESFKPFDGKIECDLPACNATNQCDVMLEEQCPAEEKTELDFLGLFLACCDNICTVADPRSDTGICPVGSCQTPFPHCSNEEDCTAQGFTFCVEGCCQAEIATDPCACECPPETPDCCLPCVACPNGGIAPQCEGLEGCAPGEFCDELGCCIPEV